MPSVSTKKYIVIMENIVNNPICPNDKYSNRITTVLAINDLGEKVYLLNHSKS